jgi:hypothetical protein
MSRRLSLAIAALLLAGTAEAQSPALPFTYPVTVGAASAQVIPTNPARRRIKFTNPNPTALVAVCPTISRTATPTITCTVNGAGSTTLLPYQSETFDGVGGTPKVDSAWNAIASAPGSALTIYEWE